MAMTREAEMALLAAGAYWDIREGNNRYDKNIRDTGNQAPIPEGWRVLYGEESHSGENVKWFGSGFSARAYRKGNEIVISYAGTETDDKGFFGFNHGSAQDFFRANFQLAVGAYSAQAYQAALFYQKIKNTNPGAKITFTGHSLGGGLASLMAVWFNQKAYVFAPAPFQSSADRTQTNHDLLKYLLGTPVIQTVKEKLGNNIDAEFARYDPERDFAVRKYNVKAWAVKGEVLEGSYLGDLGIGGAPDDLNNILAGIFFPPRMGLANVNSIEGHRTSLLKDVGKAISATDKHSIDLHAAALLVPEFERQLNKTPRCARIDV